MLAPNMLDAPVGQARGGNLPLQCQNKALLQTSSYRPYPLKITSLFNTVSLLGLWDIFWCRCSRGNIHRHAERQNFPGKVRLLSSGVSVLQLLKTVLMSWHVLATPRLVSHNRLHKSKHDQQKKSETMRNWLQISCGKSRRKPSTCHKSCSGQASYNWLAHPQGLQSSE